MLSGDRLPNLSLPQTYPASTSSGTPSSRIGSLDSSSNYSGNQYPPSLTSASSFPSANPGIGLKTPSPSPAHNVPSVAHGHSEETAQHYSSQSHNTHIYAHDSDAYPSSAMNQQQQYLDSSQSHMSGGSSYAAQPQTAGGISHYGQYQQQQPALQPGPGSYTPSQSSYGQYAYGNGVTSPQSVGHPSSMNSQLLPLPGKLVDFSSCVVSADISSNGCWTSTARISKWACSRISAKF